MIGAFFVVSLLRALACVLGSETGHFHKLSPRLGVFFLLVAVLVAVGTQRSVLALATARP